MLQIDSRCCITESPTTLPWGTLDGVDMSSKIICNFTKYFRPPLSVTKIVTLLLGIGTGTSHDPGRNNMKVMIWFWFKFSFFFLKESNGKSRVVNKILPKLQLLVSSCFSCCYWNLYYNLHHLIKPLEGNNG